MGKQLFLTGHKGFVGSHLLPKLIERGYEVETDMRYLHSRNYEAIIHLAAKTNIGLDFDPDLIESNINLTKEIFKSPSRIIVASSCSAAHLTNPYAYTKRYAEHLCSIHPNALALRFHNVYGKNASRGIVKYLMDQPDKYKIVIRGKSLVRDYIEVNDIVSVIIRSIKPGVWIDMEELRKFESEMGVAHLLDLAFNQGINIAKPEMKVNRMVGVIDVGSGVGTTTLELAQLYMKLSGKTFELEFTEAGEHEPVSMVANNPVPSIGLEQGLLKLINNE